MVEVNEKNARFVTGKVTINNLEPALLQAMSDMNVSAELKTSMFKLVQVISELKMPQLDHGRAVAAAIAELVNTVHTEQARTRIQLQDLRKSVDALTEAYKQPIEYTIELDRNVSTDKIQAMKVRST